MTGDSDVQNPQAGGSKAGKGKNKNQNQKKKGNQGGDNPQASTSTSEQLAGGIAAVSLSSPVTPEPPSGAVAGQAQAKSGGKKKQAKKGQEPVDEPFLNIEQAFEKEDRLDAEAKKKKWASKNNAEDAFAELSQLVGFQFGQSNQKHLCLRPAFASGKGGDVTKVSTNFFRMKICGNDVFQYDIVFLKSDESSAVQIEQEVGRKFKRLTKRINQRLLATFKTSTGSALFSGIATAYDNDRILIASKPLPNVPRPGGAIFNFRFIESENERPQTIFIRIKPTVKVGLTFTHEMSNTSADQNRAVLQVIDIIAKSHAFQHDIIYGSKIFLSAQNKRRIDMATRNSSTPYEIAFGYHQSTQLCEGGVMQNIDRATAVLYKGGPLIRTICQLLGIERPDYNTMIEGYQHEALKELTYLRFETNYRGFCSRHTLRSFTPTPANATYFNDSDGARKSVADYFREHYALNLDYPNLPCVEYSPGRFIPVEFCTLLPDQRNQRRLREELIRIVSEHTTSQRPWERAASSVDIAQNISNQLSGNQFAIQLDPKQVFVQSRILPSPGLTYGNNANFLPADPGSWDMRQKKFLKPNVLSKWACFTLVSRRVDGPVAGKFVNELKKNGQMLGMQISNPSMPYARLEINQLEPKFKECLGKGLQLIIVMMPEDAELYSLVKSTGDKKLGVPTQVVLDKHYDPRKDRQKLLDTAYLCNLLLKINMKIGGTNLKLNVNHRCSILNEKTMVVGIDVNHPSPGENAPSIAAVVGSLDQDFSQYRTEVQVNSSRDEIVRVDEMIVPILKAFKARRNFYPEHIIVYRDGVSEGQFTQVMSREILPLHQKLATLPGKPPHLTYMIVQKRHNARFFPTEKNKATRNGNILPGSVIDTDVCHFKWFDFYLCSQNSFLGTARPGKYTVLWHSSPANANDLQMATYYLCYLFARATKSIADPAPARYAHHAAARGKVHLRQILRDRRPGDQEVNRELGQVINVVDNLKQILYFI